MFSSAIFLDLQKIFLCMTSYLDHTLGSNKCFDLFPISIKQLKRFEELVMLLVGPALPRLGDGVGLADLLVKGVFGSSDGIGSGEERQSHTSDIGVGGIHERGRRRAGKRIRSRKGGGEKDTEAKRRR